MNEKYKDMLHLPHPVSATHPRMALQDRAAQFSPFAALAGYDDALRVPVKIIYFVPDEKKDGGSYTAVEGCVRKIDENTKSLRIQGTEIPVERIYGIDFL